VIAGSVVLDASVLIRSAVANEPAAREWVRAVEAGAVEGHAPDIAYAETVSGLTKYVRADLIEPKLAAAMLAEVVKLPLFTYSHARLARASLALALEHGLSAYDASYLALAQSLDVPLVTADRQLAAAAANAELLS
jgi:predicted nucleic acid-binding protein